MSGRTTTRAATSRARRAVNGPGASLTFRRPSAPSPGTSVARTPPRAPAPPPAGRRRLPGGGHRRGVRPRRRNGTDLHGEPGLTGVDLLVLSTERDAPKRRRLSDAPYGMRWEPWSGLIRSGKAFMPETMRAIRQERLGGPEVLRLVTVDGRSRGPPRCWCGYGRPASTRWTGRRARAGRGRSSSSCRARWAGTWPAPWRRSARA